jgi:Right handed beta helix region
LVALPTCEEENVMPPLLSLLLAALVVCTGTTQDAASIQAAIDANNEIEIQGDCLIPGLPGLRLPSNRTIHAEGATLRQTANVGGSGEYGRNRAVQTNVGAAHIRWYGGRFIGRREYVGGLQWSIGFMIDSASDFLIQDAVFTDWYTDGIKIGGNMPGSLQVTLRNVTVSNSKRNGLSITCGDGIRVEQSIFETTNCAEGGTVTCSSAELNMPMCGIDFEPNADESVSNVRVTDTVSRNNDGCGIFVQTGMASQSGFQPGQNYVFDRVSSTGNKKIGIIANQINGFSCRSCTVTGGTVGFSFGAGLKGLTFEDSEVSGTSGNGINFAGVWNPIVRGITLNGRPVAYIQIASPVKMNGIDGDISIKPFEDLPMPSSASTQVWDCSTNVGYVDVTCAFINEALKRLPVKLQH